MGIKLQVKSSPGVGSRFYFTVELAPGGKIEKLAKKYVKNAKNLAADCSVRALVVDDNEVNREVLAQLLKKIGGTVEEAEDGMRALEKIPPFNPDIIFIDMRMPGMDGEEVIRKIIQDYGPDRFKLVAITASALGYEKEKCLDFGCHDYIVKPFRNDQIYGAIQNLLGVEFAFRKPPSDNEGKKMRAADFSGMVLPRELHEKLMEAAGLYNVTTLDILIKEIGSLGQKERALSGYLEELAKEYKMKDILDVLGKVKPG